MLTNNRLSLRINNTKSLMFIKNISRHNAFHVDTSEFSCAWWLCPSFSALILIPCIFKQLFDHHFNSIIDLLMGEPYPNFDPTWQCFLGKISTPCFRNFFHTIINFHIYDLDFCLHIQWYTVLMIPYRVLPYIIMGSYL
jgi:hypothetical protein